MAKLALKVDDLVVESFHTVPEMPTRGTVVGAADTVEAQCATFNTACPDFSCYANSQCCSDFQTCGYTCLLTCTCGPSGTNCLCPKDSIDRC